MHRDLNFEKDQVSCMDRVALRKDWKSASSPPTYWIDIDRAKDGRMQVWRAWAFENKEGQASYGAPTKSAAVVVERYLAIIRKQIVENGYHLAEPRQFSHLTPVKEDMNTFFHKLELEKQANKNKPPSLPAPLSPPPALLTPDIVDEIIANVKKAREQESKKKAKKKNPPLPPRKAKMDWW